VVNETAKSAVGAIQYKMVVKPLIKLLGQLGNYYDRTEPKTLDTTAQLKALKTSFWFFRFLILTRATNTPGNAIETPTAF